MAAHSSWQDLLDRPAWRPGDLGRPIPDSPHAVSVCLPTWRDNVGYEENDPRVHERITTGYPRFIFNRFCRELFEECRRRFARAGESCQAFPSQATAVRFARWLQDRGGENVRVVPLEVHNVHAAFFAETHASAAKDYWQHSGEGVTSRLAEASLNSLRGLKIEDRGSKIEDCDPRPSFLDPRSSTDDDGQQSLPALRQRVAALAGVPADDVWLFPCGMSAHFAVHRAICSLRAGARSVQFGFPYVDTLKIQEKFGPGAHFFPRGDAAEIERLTSLLETSPVSALYTEFPSNPLLACPDLQRLAGLSRRHGVPLVVDDTLAGFLNVDLLPAADVVTSSLTKYFSGVGDVTSGALVVNPDSPFHDELSAVLRAEADEVIWPADAAVLERNSRDYAERMPRINAHAAALAAFLAEHPKVARVYYPMLSGRENFDAFRRPGGGYGGLLSLELQDAERTAPRFFDALKVSKGPNLGTSYSLACPYTILAHYGELDFAESCGVSRWLVRVSVGLEDPADLIRRFEHALAAAAT